ncbi:hypothetical protein PR048_002041 [Dryococelus australis]|uniref:Uncharacterized protein n=1 Tax=Dryococelus australis TaxID=614101 RepID=A0ABQ9IJ89_9NEOP|nr:hypothetical protein PR048_002041 [Dryococelus australis]
MRSNFLEACTNIIKKSSLKSIPLSKNCHCLQPKERTSWRNCQHIVTLAKSPTHFHGYKYSLGQLEATADMGDVKYPNMTILIKAVLSLSH